MASKQQRPFHPILPIFAALLVLAAVFFFLLPKNPALPALEAALDSLAPAPISEANDADSAIAEAAVSYFSAEIMEAPKQHFRSAAGTISLKALDLEALTLDLTPEIQALAAEHAAKASRRAELYDDEGDFLPEVLEELYTQAISERLSHAEDYCKEQTLPVTMRYRKGTWVIEELSALQELTALPAVSMPGFADAAAGLEPVSLTYRLPDWTSPGPVPDEALFGTTRDPQVILDLLASDNAQRLLDGQKTDWSAEHCAELDRDVHYYLDESILVLVWQELEHGAVATVSEVFIQDASQFRRLITGETSNTSHWDYPTVLAQKANAVVAASGDLYQNRSPAGIAVYDGKVLQGDLQWGQSCLVTDTGEFLFVYENQLSSMEEAQRLCDAHHVMFSLCFGPVIIDDGKDVTPYTYPFGEIQDTFARCALGMLGQRHYLIMTFNAERPRHVVYLTLAQAAASMLEHGCSKAYTLDGGQTASIVFHGELINPVQFGAERTMSDILYFATALPSAG